MKPARIIILAVAVVSAGVAGLLALQIARGGKPSIEMQKVVEREALVAAPGCGAQLVADRDDESGDE